METLVEAIRHDWTQSMGGVLNDQVKYMDFLENSDEISLDAEPMEFD